MTEVKWQIVGEEPGDTPDTKKVQLAEVSGLASTMHVDLEASFLDNLFVAIPDSSGSMRPDMIAAAELQIHAFKDLNAAPVYGDIHGAPAMVISAGQLGMGKSWNTLSIRHNDEPPSSHTYSRKRKKSKMRKNRK